MLQGRDSSLIDKCNHVGPILLEGVDPLKNWWDCILAGDPVFVLLGIHSTTLDEAQANVNDVTVVHWVACSTGIESTNEEACCKGLKTFGGMRFSSRSLVVVRPYFVMSQSNMWRKTVFAYFMWIDLYVSQIAFDRFTRKTLERAAFIVTMSPQVF